MYIDYTAAILLLMTVVPLLTVAGVTAYWVIRQRRMGNDSVSEQR